MESISIPDTPAGRQARAWLACFERGELDPLRRFAAERLGAAALAVLSAEAQARWQCDLYRDTSGLVPAHVERSSETELSLLVRARVTGELLRVGFAVGGEAPHLIERFGVFFLAPWEPPYGPAVSRAELVAELRDLVERLADIGCFAGAVLLAHGDDLRLDCEHIYEPAGMGDTDSPQLDSDEPRLARGYTWQGADGQPTQLQSNLDNWVLPPRGGPFGCGFSTVGDLHRFGRALLRHELLSPRLTELVLSGKVQMGPNQSYGYGFQESCFAGLRSIGHGGGAPGANARFVLYPELGDTLVVLSKHRSPDRRSDRRPRTTPALRPAGGRRLTAATSAAGC